MSISHKKIVIHHLSEKRNRQKNTGGGLLYTVHNWIILSIYDTLYIGHTVVVFKRKKKEVEIQYIRELNIY